MFPPSPLPPSISYMFLHLEVQQCFERDTKERNEQLKVVDAFCVFL